MTIKISTTLAAALTVCLSVGCMGQPDEAERFDSEESEFNGGANTPPNQAPPDANTPPVNAAPNACVKHEVITDACHDAAYFLAAAAQICGANLAPSDFTLAQSCDWANDPNGNANAALFAEAEFSCCPVMQCDPNANCDPNGAGNNGSNAP